jgi:uncharacterized protein YlxP (DUF503 family)
MIVGVLTLELVVYEAMSLKDKRRVIKSLKERIRNRFNVSVAEVDHLDSRQRATLAVAIVSNDARFANGCLDRIVDLVRTASPATLIDFQKETL